jgi:Zn-dependent protease
MPFLRLFGDNPIFLIPWFTALLIAITIHEFAHGLAAYKLGDDTAARAGRLTLNPISHIDPIGGFMLLLVGFGWAKPVPVNMLNVRKGNLGRAIVSFAGVFFNLMMAVLSLFLLKYFLLDTLGISNLAVKFLAFSVYINLALFIFNLLPIPPLDGYHILESFAPKLFVKFAPIAERYGMIILLAVVFLTNIIGYAIGIIIFLFSIIFNLDIFLLAFGGL